MSQNADMISIFLCVCSVFELCDFLFDHAFVQCISVSKCWRCVCTPCLSVAHSTPVDNGQCGLRLMVHTQCRGRNMAREQHTVGQFYLQLFDLFLSQEHKGEAMWVWFSSLSKNSGAVRPLKAPWCWDTGWCCQGRFPTTEIQTFDLYSSSTSQIIMLSFATLLNFRHNRPTWMIPPSSAAPVEDAGWMTWPADCWTLPETDVVNYSER